LFNRLDGEDFKSSYRQERRESLSDARACRREQSLVVACVHIYYLLDLVERTNRRKINEKKGGVSHLRSNQKNKRKNDRVNNSSGYSDPAFRLLRVGTLGIMDRMG
jgi:hypothetical protein